MLWIREEEVFTRFDYGSVEQRCRELDLHGLCGDVRRVDPEAPPPLFITIFTWIYAFQRPGSLWMALRRILRIEIEELLVTA
jgi:hypothetical protein